MVLALESGRVVEWMGLSSIRSPDERAKTLSVYRCARTWVRLRLSVVWRIDLISEHSVFPGGARRLSELRLVFSGTNRSRPDPPCLSLPQRRATSLTDFPQSLVFGRYSSQEPRFTDKRNPNEISFCFDPCVAIWPRRLRFSERTDHGPVWAIHY